MPSNLISIADCRRLIAQGRAMLILDVRTPAEHARLHATGARLTPLDTLDPSAIAAQRRDGDPLYVICQSGGRAAKACQRLREAGLTEVYNTEGGTAAWERGNLPVERGRSNVVSLERQVRIIAGSLVLSGSLLAWAVHPSFLAIPTFVGGGLIFAGITDYCGMALVLCKMPWNRR